MKKLLFRIIRHIEIFFESGKQRKQINYYNGLPQKLYEFYANGLPKYTEENEKEMKYVTVKKSWYYNGQIQDAMEITDFKNKKYTQKLFYENGQVKSEGLLVLSIDGKSYVKDGSWNFYDSNGKNKRSEKYSATKLTSN